MSAFDRLPSYLAARLPGWASPGPQLAKALGTFLAASALPFLLITYLSLAEGGYDDIVRSEVGIAVWWSVLVGSIAGLLPASRPGRTAWVAVGLLGGFAAWTAIGVLWSESAERSIVEVARVTSLLGVFVLALGLQRPGFISRVAGATAAAVALIAVLALASRLHPSWFPPNEVAEVLPTEEARLNYPLTYWNALATLLAIGLPLVLWVASSARRTMSRALAVASLPVLFLVGYYAISRGGLFEAAIALTVLITLHPRRLLLFPPLLLGSAGGAVLILAASRRNELADGVVTAVALDQGDEMAAIVLAVCALAALASVGLRILGGRSSFETPRIGRPAAVRATAGVLVVIVAGAVALGVPGGVADRWDAFKEPVTPTADADRFTAAGGSGRYQWWGSAIEASASNRLTGIGPGTWEYWWERGDSELQGAVKDAHSLYLENLGELGLVGAALISAFVLGIVGVGVRRSLRDRFEVERVEVVAALTAGTAAFAAAAAVDWSWEMTVLPVAFLLLAAALLGGDAAPTTRQERGRGPALTPLRGVLAGLSVLSVLVIAVPMLSERWVRSSKEQVDDGELLGALESARRAGGLLPIAASPDLQEALVLELGGNLPGAANAAREATEDEPTNYQTWLVLSRVEAELGNSEASSVAYREARSLNPRSGLFGG